MKVCRKSFAKRQAEVWMRSTLSCFSFTPPQVHSYELTPLPWPKTTFLYMSIKMEIPHTQKLQMKAHETQCTIRKIVKQYSGLPCPFQCVGETNTQFTCEQPLKQVLTMFLPVVYGSGWLLTVGKKSLTQTGLLETILLAMFYLASRHLFQSCQIGWGQNQNSMREIWNNDIC